MPKYVLRKRVLSGKHAYPAGQTVELTTAVGDRLVASGYATKTSKPGTPAASNKAAESGKGKEPSNPTNSED